MKDYWRFCERIGANPYHPDAWTADQRALYRAWRLGKFRAHWRWLMQIGQVNLIRQQSGRDYLIREIREDLREALAKPRKPTRACPCHRRYGGSSKTNPVQEQRESNPFVYGNAPAGEVALAWLHEQFAGERHDPAA